MRIRAINVLSLSCFTLSCLRWHVVLRLRSPCVSRCNQRCYDDAVDLFGASVVVVMWEVVLRFCFYVTHRVKIFLKKCAHCVSMEGGIAQW